jgi:hypothetical protein
MAAYGLTPWMEQQLLGLLGFAESKGIPAKVVSTLRSCSQQDALWDQGRGTAGPIVTDAKGCQSWHVWGRAADLVIDGPLSDYAVLGDQWKRWGGVWGGDFPIGDFGHFEWHPGISHVSEICPTGHECPAATEWPEDRPLLARPLPRLVLGLGLAAAGMGVAYKVILKK